MKLATFLAPGASDPPRAGEVRGDEVVAFASGTPPDLASPRATGPPPMAPPTRSPT